MKNLLIIALTFVAFSFGYSQEKSADFGPDAAVYQKNKTNGVYVFQVDANVYTTEKVKLAGSYYKDNFTVTPKKKGDQIEVQLVLKGVTEQNKKIVTRFFVTMEIKEVLYNNKSMFIEFFLLSHQVLLLYI